MHIRYSNQESKMTVNFMNVKLWHMIPAIFLLAIFSFYFIFISEGNFTEEYIFLQKDLFFYLNGKLSEYPSLQYNLTQFGDVLISFSLLSVFIVYAPKLWEALITSAILSLIISASLKEIFSVPRPPVILNIDDFTIIGRTHLGYASLPSGHSISAFFVITILIYAFMPQKNIAKIFWMFFMLTMGLVVAFSRVAVGAHFPFDVVIGSAIGYIVAVIGILINNKIKWFNWFKNKEYHPVLILLLGVCTLVIITKIVSANLLIFYFSLSALIVTLYLIINSYVKKN